MLHNITWSVMCELGAKFSSVRDGRTKLWTSWIIETAAQSDVMYLVPRVGEELRGGLDLVEVEGVVPRHAAVQPAPENRIRVADTNPRYWIDTGNGYVWSWMIYHFRKLMFFCKLFFCHITFWKFQLDPDRLKLTQSGTILAKCQQ